MTTSDLAVPPWLAILIVVCVCGSAIWKGEWQERTVAVAIIVAWLLTPLTWPDLAAPGRVSSRRNL